LEHQKKSKLNLVTVVGYHSKTLNQLIEHYKDIVDDIKIVVYRNDINDTIQDKVEEIIKPYGLKVFDSVVAPIFNWEVVTSLYNKTKRTSPDDWWIVSDSDELHTYHKPIREIISECEENGWEFVTGGFLDRIGRDGVFEEVNFDDNLWTKFPIAGFFRYPISKAMPNKCCVMKGRIDVTPGQHFALVDGQSTWRNLGWNHPLRYPIDNGFVQVNHFKWDSTVVDRLKHVASVEEDYTYHWEYKRMLDYISSKDYKIPMDLEFLLEPMTTNDYYDYPHWDFLKEKIINI
jgi:hypothetical protein